MNKSILLAFITLIMVGCRYKTTGINIKEASNAVIIVDKHTLDSCEYYPNYGHKGSCRFCAERRKQEMKKFVEQLKGR